MLTFGILDSYLRRASQSGTTLFYFAVMALAGVLTPPFVDGQVTKKAEPKRASIIGTVLDVNHDTVPGATVVLTGPGENDHRTLLTPENGFFEFRDVEPGVAFTIKVSAKDFDDWTSSPITLDPGQFKILSGIQLRIQPERTNVQVNYDPEVVATEQFKVQETQRVFGFVPNFYVAYDENAEPLTAKRKFLLALKVSVDPVTIVGTAFVAGAKQASNSPHFGQGASGYGERFGAVAADGVSDIMIGGAILPSLLHQDPRYFYQGTGTTGSRIRHAVFSPFVARGDNGKWQPNYSSLGGDLASSGLANLYYPKSNRGVGLVFGNFAIGTAERIGASVAQEFLLGRFTRRGGKMQ
jgi:hypothetical protein